MELVQQCCSGNSATLMLQTAKRVLALDSAEYGEEAGEALSDSKWRAECWFPVQTSTYFLLDIVLGTREQVVIRSIVPALQVLSLVYIWMVSEHPAHTGAQCRIQ